MLKDVVPSEYVLFYNDGILEGSKIVSARTNAIGSVSKIMGYEFTLDFLSDDYWTIGALVTTLSIYYRRRIDTKRLEEAQKLLDTLTKTLSEGLNAMGFDTSIVFSIKDRGDYKPFVPKKNELPPELK